MNSNTTWTWRLPVVLSIAALTAALLGSTSVGQAFSGASFAKRAAFAKNAGAVNGIKASRTPQPGKLVPLGSDGKFPASVGLAGPKGEKGDKGDTGTQGPAGLSGYGYYIQEQDVAPNAFQPLAVSCPAGQKVLGGGVSTTNPGFAKVAESAPTIESPMGWGAVVQNESNTTFAAYVWALCANVAS
jgi:hypothetical protein